jgi:hypothetical protein
MAVSTDGILARAVRARWGRCCWLFDVIDDDELIDKLGALTACIVVTKQGRDQRKLAKLQRLRELNERTAGVPIRAFPGLDGLAPKVDGEPEVVGPYSQFDDAVLPTTRTLGYRSKERRQVPIVHAKLALQFASRRQLASALASLEQDTRISAQDQLKADL